MVFDTEEQKKIALELIMSATYPGKALKVMAKFQEDVEKAIVVMPIPLAPPKPSEKPENE